MRRASVCFVLLFLAVDGALAKDGKKRRRPAPRPGIHWQADLQAGLDLAVREGRPILFAVNALENESANIQLATKQYRSHPWGEATRGFVCFVGNPNDHKGSDGLCTRYPGIPCKTHKDALKFVARRFGSDLISPQHIVLEPDQNLAYRKEYYTRVVKPALLERWLSSIAPDLAFSRAGIAREKKIKGLVGAPIETRRAKADAWIATPDGLVAAAVTNALDELFEPGERLPLIKALARCDRSQAHVIELIAEDRISFPDEEPVETVAWLRALLRVNRSVGLRACARALCRSTQANVRGQILEACLGAANLKVDKVVAWERNALWEALALAGDERGGPTVLPLPKDAAWRDRILRAIRRGGLSTGAKTVDLGLALSQPGDVSALRRALLDAPADQAREHQTAVARILTESRWLGLRAAAAIALIRAGIETKDDLVVRTLQATVFDAVEGPDVREAVRALLGEDPGTDLTEWVRLVKARIRKPEGKK